MPVGVPRGAKGLALRREKFEWVSGAHARGRESLLLYCTTRHVLFFASYWHRLSGVEGTEGVEADWARRVGSRRKTAFYCRKPQLSCPLWSPEGINETNEVPEAGFEAPRVVRRRRLFGFELQKTTSW